MWTGLAETVQMIPNKFGQSTKNATEDPEMQILGSFPQFLAPPGGENYQKW